MTNRIEWIMHKDKEILSIDFSGLSDEELAEKIITFRNFIVDSGRKNIHGLLNVSNAYMYGKAFTEVQKTAKMVNPQIETVAVVGSTKVQEVIIRAIRYVIHIKFETFDSMEKAKDWLVEN